MAFHQIFLSHHPSRAQPRKSFSIPPALGRARETDPAAALRNWSGLRRHHNLQLPLSDWSCGRLRCWSLIRRAVRASPNCGRRTRASALLVSRSRQSPAARMAVENFSQSNARRARCKSTADQFGCNCAAWSRSFCASKNSPCWRRKSARCNQSTASFWFVASSLVMATIRPCRSPCA